MRNILPETSISPSASSQMENFHKDVVTEVKTAISAHKIVVVGMASNPFVKKARNLLQEQGSAFHYLEYGSYLAKWKERLAIKMWSGWPTFPQVFIDGVLIGGYSDLEKHFAKK